MIKPQPGGYWTGTGRWAEALIASLLTGAALSATGNSDSAEFGDRGTIRANLNVTGVSGQSPTLDVTMQTSEDGTSWNTLGTFSQMTGTGPQRKVFAGADRFVRASYTVGGTRFSTVTPGGTSPPAAPAISGTPTPSGALDGAHTVVITITTGGALGTAQMTYAIDGGAASTAAVIPGNGIEALGSTGVTATFVAGTYTVGDTYTFNTYAAPSVSATLDLEGV